MKTRMLGLPCVMMGMIVLAIGATAFSDGAQHKDDGGRKSRRNRRPTPTVIAFSDARLKIELNGTDDDAGIQVFIDAGPWEWLDIYDPSGQLLFRSDTKGKFALQGGTELFLESGEPNFSELSLEELLERFPEGKYPVRVSMPADETVMSHGLTLPAPKTLRVDSCSCDGLSSMSGCCSDSYKKHGQTYSKMLRTTKCGVFQTAKA